MESVAPIIEILFLAIIINYILSLVWKTRSIDLVIGVSTILTLFALSFWVALPVLHEIMRNILSVAFLAILILFQPELRHALSKISLKGSKAQQITEFDHFLNSLTQCVFRLSEKRIGAILVLEQNDTLEEFARNGVMLKGEFSPELIESIFMTSTPLHDGAVIIRGSQVLAAACILPLAGPKDTAPKKVLGTRHLAGLGISEIADAFAIVISEETGQVSLFREGEMTRGVDKERFKAIVRSIFNPPKLAIRPGPLRRLLKV